MSSRAEVLWLCVVCKSIKLCYYSVVTSYSFWITYAVFLLAQHYQWQTRVQSHRQRKNDQNKYTVTPVYTSLYNASSTTRAARMMTSFATKLCLALFLSLFPSCHDKKLDIFWSFWRSLKDSFFFVKILEGFLVNHLICDGFLTVVKQLRKLECYKSLVLDEHRLECVCYCNRVNH